MAAAPAAAWAECTKTKEPSCWSEGVPITRDALFYSAHRILLKYGILRRRRTADV